jgi:hypothetical protein
MTTRRREFRKRLEPVLRGALARHGIDDLGLELDLIDAALSVYDELAGRPAAGAAARDPLFAPPAGGALDLAGWPEDVREIVALVCQLWRLTPPRRGRSGGPFAQWIADARELSTACGAVEPARVLRAVRASFERHMLSHGGVAPFTVGGPGSLVKSARFTAGTLSVAAQDNVVARDDFGGIWL